MDAFSAMSSATKTPTQINKSPDVISGMFNRIAKTYDLLNDCMTLGLHRQWKQKACQKLHLLRGSNVLDVCTGTGDLASILSTIVGENGEVRGVDFSEGMLSIAQQRFSHIKNIHWQQGDALSLPFSDNCFDGSIISFGLRNVNDTQKALAEMIRVTRPGGWIVNLDTASDYKNPLFWFYFSALMPRLGRFFSKDAQAYRYLCQSAEAFCAPKDIEKTLQGLGLVATGIQAMGFGAVSCQYGQKPISKET